MTGREFLKKIIKIDKLIDYKIDQVQELRSKIISPKIVNYENERVQSSGGNDALEKMLDKIHKLEKRIDDSIDELIDMKSTAIHIIDKIDDTTYKLILSKRYLDNKTMEEIGDDLGYTWRWINVLHAKALKEFEKIYNNSY